MKWGYFPFSTCESHIPDFLMIFSVPSGLRVSQVIFSKLIVYINMHANDYGCQFNGA